MSVHAYTVKILVEEDAECDPFWRGHITDVKSGKRRYVKSLEEITDVFQSVLKELEPIEMQEREE